jgi:peptide deformylase
MIRPILRYPAPILHQKAVEVPAVTPEVAALIDDLVQTMHGASGVGLAAPQVGLSERVFVIDLSVGKAPGDLIALVNPTFIRRDGMQLEEEGCLSVPGFHATVARPLHVVIRGLDRNGHERTIEAHGLLARALQHEMDHLDGILFIDRLKPVQRRLILRRIERLRQRGRW